MEIQILTNARIVTPAADFLGTCVIERGRIAEVREGVDPEGLDLGGAWLIPGIIDIHSDHLEKEVAPRPQARFPLELALHHADMRALHSGVTTVLSCVRFSTDKAKWGALGEDSIAGSRILQELSRKSTVRQFIQARWDTNFEGAETLLEAMDGLELLKLIVYNENIPGQRQFRDLGKLAEERAARERVSVEEARLGLEEKIRKNSLVNNRGEVNALFGGRIPIGSHDDTTVEHVIEAKAAGATLSEMPTTLAAALKAKELGLWVCMGAPNLVRGKSSYDNLSADEALDNDAVDIFCSDYHFPSMLTALGKLLDRGLSPSRAMEFLSLNPARCLGLDDRLGGIEEGKLADLVCCSLDGAVPSVHYAWVNGECKMQARNRAPAGLAVA